MMETTSARHRVYRLDRFVVPSEAHQEFLARAKSTHELLRAQPGFIQDFLLEQPAAGGAVSIVTLVEWRDAQSIDNARAAVREMHKAIGFNPQELFARLGIKADLGAYNGIDV